MKLYMDRRIMTDIMMHIFSILYRAVGHADHAKNIAGIMGTDYRALNAAVGWAGRKIMGKTESDRKQASVDVCCKRLQRGR
jgi:hypothetical protein